MAELTRVVLTNLPAVFFGISAVAAVAVRSEGSLAERLLRWLLLLPVGAASLLAGIYHLFFPQIAEESIGWQVSPFQFEIGIANLALGVVAVAAFWRSRSFQAAIAWCAALFCAGLAVGHVRDAVVAHDFAPNNFGLLLPVMVIQAVLLPVLVWIVNRRGGVRRMLRAL